MSTIKVLIVGAGITGSVVAFELRRLFGDALASGKMGITVWDKAKGPGGRMTTSKPSRESSCIADLGAQYFSISPADRQTFSRFYDALENAGLLVRMRASIVGDNPYSGEAVQEMVCPKGNSAVVKYFLENSGATFQADHLLTSLDSDAGGRIIANAASETTEDSLDLVVLTMPVPQIIQLKGNIFEEETLETLRKNPVEYSSRYTLVLFFPDKTHIGLDFGFSFMDDDFIRYIAVDNLKRGATTEPAAVVLHSTWQFGKKYIDGDKEVAEKLLMDRFYQLYPDVPRTDVRKIHKWRYSQVRARTGKGTLDGYFQLSPAVFCAGDGFTGSSLEQCFESAVNVSAAIYKNFKNRV